MYVRLYDSFWGEFVLGNDPSLSLAWLVAIENASCHPDLSVSRFVNMIGSSDSLDLWGEVPR